MPVVRGAWVLMVKARFTAQAPSPLPAAGPGALLGAPLCVRERSATGECLNAAQANGMGLTDKPRDQSGAVRTVIALDAELAEVAGNAASRWLRPERDLRRIFALSATLLPQLYRHAFHVIREPTEFIANIGRAQSEVTHFSGSVEQELREIFFHGVGANRCG